MDYVDRSNQFQTRLLTPGKIKSELAEKYNLRGDNNLKKKVRSEIQNQIAKNDVEKERLDARGVHDVGQDRLIMHNDWLRSMLQK